MVAPGEVTGEVDGREEVGLRRDVPVSGPGPDAGQRLGSDQQGGGHVGDTVGVEHYSVAGPILQFLNALDFVRGGCPPCRP